MKHPPLLFIDVETLGLLEDSPIWEVAAMLVTANGVMRQQFSVFVEHDPALVDPDLPQSFRDDYGSRYVPDRALDPAIVVTRIAQLAENGAHVCGSNPSFDMDRIAKLDPFQTIGWHYHAIDVPTLVHGYLLGKGIMPAPPWKSDFLSRCVGVDPADFDRHTALGDVQWCHAMWEAVTP